MAYSRSWEEKVTGMVLELCIWTLKAKYVLSIKETQVDF
jgi:hypothetical protein